MKVDKASTSSYYLERFLQNFIVIVMMTYVFIGIFLGWVIWALLVYYYPLLRIPLLVYAGHIYYDYVRGVAEKGLKRSERFRNFPLWRHYKNYFPAKLFKTSELPADKNYIFCCFPHGVLSTGPFCVFGSNLGGFVQIFPGIKPWLIILSHHFHTPFVREFFLSIGTLPSNATCINRMLNPDEHKGNALALMVGGAQEAFYCEAGTYRVFLKKRKGFARLALMNGASLVPVLSFGENDIYSHIRFDEDSALFKIQLFIKKVTGIAPILFYGRFLDIPYRRPLNVVVGAPIHTTRVMNPTAEEVDALHGKFVTALGDLFEREKHKFLENADDKHLIVS